MIATVIFDLDGTITDSFDGIVDAFNHALDVHGHPPRDREQVKKLMGTPLEDMLVALHPDMGRGEVERIARTYRDYYITICGERSPLFPDVIRALDLLSDRTLVCASTKHTLFMEEILRTQDIMQRFQLIQGSEEIPQKPRPDLFLKVMQLTGSKVVNTAMVGDADLDVEAALGAGIMPVGVLTGIGTRNELEQAGCRHIFPNLYASAKFIKSLE